MTFADFLFQAGFWQWFGLICLAACVATAVGKFRLWGNVTANKTKHIYTDKAQP